MRRPPLGIVRCRQCSRVLPRRWTLMARHIWAHRFARLALIALRYTARPPSKGQQQP